jgi:transcriptional regulator with XRE-family HTH domain
MNKVTSRIRELLETQNKTQKELATYLGKKQSNMSHMLKYGTINEKELIKIAEFFNVDPAEFFVPTPEIILPTKDLDLNLASCIQQLQNLKAIMAKQEEVLRAKDETIQILKQTMKQL